VLRPSAAREQLLDQKNRGLTELANVGIDETHSLDKAPEKRCFWAFLGASQVQI
jgi:hypothetical protein